MKFQDFKKYGIESGKSHGGIGGPVMSQDYRAGDSYWNEGTRGPCTDEVWHSYDDVNGSMTIISKWTCDWDDCGW